MCLKHLIVVFLVSYSPVAFSDSIHSDKAWSTKGFQNNNSNLTMRCDDNKNCTIKNTFCIDERCTCKSKYEFNSNATKCIKCPGLDDPCSDSCCNSDSLNLFCYENKCRSCTEDGKFSCSKNSGDQDTMAIVTQVAMSAGLTIGIITILVLFWKICTKTNYGRSGQRARGRSSTGSTGSGGSLQRAVAERMRDVPPPYCSSLPPPSDTPPPYHLVNNSGFVNASFEGDLSLPPPDYSTVVSEVSSASISFSSLEENFKVEAENLEIKDPDIVSTTLHI